MSSFSDPAISESAKIAGTALQSPVISGPTFAFIVSFIGIVTDIIALIVCREWTSESLRSARLKYYNSSFVQFIFDIFYSSSLAVLFSASSSYIALPLVLYWLWSNLTMILIGRELIPRFLYWIAMGYSLLYSFFLFIQCKLSWGSCSTFSDFSLSNY
jgi:hypothetical protein